MTTKSKPERDPFDGAEPVTVTTTGPSTRPDGSQDFAPGKAPDGHPAKDGDDSNVRTRHQARVWAFDQVKSSPAVWGGLCLAFVRSCYNVGPLFPDARTAWLEAEHKHRETDPAKIPNGKPVFYKGGDHWHVAFGIGNGLCVSTDIRRDGKPNVCRIDAIPEAWAGFELLGHTDDLNGEDPVPAPRKRRRISDRAFKVRILRTAITRSRSANHPARTFRLRQWLREVRRTR